jgi:zinc/manganese transport system substrate-binding protein
MRRWVISVLLLAVLAGVTARVLVARGRSAGRIAGPLRVVATTSIIGDWARQIGGDDIDLATLVGPDGDPHDYEPVPGDSRTLLKADLILENGLGLEHWLAKLCTSAHAKATRVVVTRGIEPRRMSEAEAGTAPAGESDDDPHAWQDVKAAEAMVCNIRDALVRADPPHAAAYRDRTDAYLKKLDALDQYAAEQIRSIPAHRRTLVTSHDAFGYFGRRYGLDISRSALESVTTEAADPSAQQIAATVARIKSTGVPVIFVENIQNPKLIGQIAAEAGVTVGPPLYSDAIGKPGTAGDTYLKMVRYNVDTLVKALKP